jgi:hypothetical protein
MGSRNRQRATFQKRQREMQRQERQAEKRARRQGRIVPDADERDDVRAPSDLPPGIGQYPTEIGRYPDEDKAPAEETNATR